MQEKAGLRFGESHPSKEGVGQEIAAVHQGPRVNILLKKVVFVSPSINMK